MLLCRFFFSLQRWKKRYGPKNCKSVHNAHALRFDVEIRLFVHVLCRSFEGRRKKKSTWTVEISLKMEKQRNRYGCELSSFGEYHTPNVSYAFILFFRPHTRSICLVSSSVIFFSASLFLVLISNPLCVQIYRSYKSTENESLRRKKH